MITIFSIILKAITYIHAYNIYVLTCSLKFPLAVKNESPTLTYCFLNKCRHLPWGWAKLVICNCNYKYPTTWCATRIEIDDYVHIYNLFVVCMLVWASEWNSYKISSAFGEGGGWRVHFMAELCPKKTVSGSVATSPSYICIREREWNMIRGGVRNEGSSTNRD
jgi:hypothetical protein